MAGAVVEQAVVDLVGEDEGVVAGGEVGNELELAAGSDVGVTSVIQFTSGVRLERRTRAMLRCNE